MHNWVYATELGTELAFIYYQVQFHFSVFLKEDDLLQKRKNEIMDQVLVDQLSRHVLSDVEQDRNPARQNPADPTSNFNTAPLRFKSRRLHETK